MRASEGAARRAGAALRGLGAASLRPAALLVLWVTVGVGLFFLVRLAGRALPDSLLLAVSLEEGSKMALFVAASLRLRRREAAAGYPAPAARLLMPFFAVAAFGVAENLLYYLRYPTSSIYGRLLYSYPIHLNTAMLFVLAFEAAAGRTGPRRLSPIGAALLGAVGYHSGLNALSVLAPRFALYAVGPVNLIVFASLQWWQRTLAVHRSLRHASG